MSSIFILLFLCFCLPKGLPQVIDLPKSIVGSVDVVEGGAPYQVSLRSRSGSHFCEGAIMNKRWILTAAHCIVGKTTLNTKVIVGTNSLINGGVKYSVDQFIVHEDFNSFELTYALSVVKVSKDIKFNDLVQSIQLPETDTEGGAELTLTGWSMPSLSGSLSDNLQIIKLKALDIEQCQQIYDDVNSTQVYDTQICSLSMSGEGACYDEPGGPLVQGGKLVGIMSWGVPCLKGYPGVFTRVYAFKDWIIKNTIDE